MLEIRTAEGVASPSAVAAPRQTRKRWSMVAAGALTVLLAALVALVATVVVVPRAMGAVPLTVLTASMEPALAPGDLVVVRPTPANDIRIGDVITFQPESGNSTLVTHRVVGVTLGSGGVSGFTTQGDDNDAADAPILAEQVKGRVAYSVPFVGHLTNAALGSQLAAVAGVGILGYGLVTVVMAYRTKDEQHTNEKERS